MPGTTPNLAFRYPLATEAPDGPGGMLALATDVDNALKGVNWFPSLGGGSGATVGSGGGSDGKYTQIGKHVSAKGRLLFGSSASFGAGTATVSNLPGPIDTQHSTGYGFYIPTSGNPIPVFLTPFDGANMVIRPVQSSTAGSVSSLAIASTIGTPAQSAVLLFTLDLVLS